MRTPYRQTCGIYAFSNEYLSTTNNLKVCLLLSREIQRKGRSQYSLYNNLLFIHFLRRNMGIQKVNLGNLQFVFLRI